MRTLLDKIEDKKIKHSNVTGNNKATTSGGGEATKMEVPLIIVGSQQEIDNTTTGQTEDEEVGNVKWEGEETSSSEEDEYWIDPTMYFAPPAEYWHIQKLVKYIKAGNKTATSLALACLKDHDLNDEFNKLAIRDIGGLEVLINLLETNDFKCILGSLDVLGLIAMHKQICKNITHLGLIPILVRLLRKESKTVTTKVAYLISIISYTKQTRHEVLEYGGVPLLIGLLEINPKLLTTPIDKLPMDLADTIKSASSSAKALYSLSKSKTIKKEMIDKGIIKRVTTLLTSIHEELVLYTMGFFQNCATMEKCQLAIETEDIIGGILQHLNSKRIEVRQLCSQAICKSCEKEGPRKLVHIHHGCKLLVNLLKDKTTSTEIPVLQAVTGAIWKCAMYDNNLIDLDELDTNKLLIKLLTHEDEDILINVIGGLAEMSKIRKNTAEIHRAGGIRILVSFLTYANTALLQNVNRVIGECANNPDCMEELEKLDAVRLIWSLLKNSSKEVQASAGFALAPCIEYATDSGEMVRSYVGGLELLVNSLKSTDEVVLAAVCSAISKVATDRENLAVISEHGVMPLLANLIHTKNELLQQHLSSAIAECCNWQNNCHMFGQLGILTHIIKFIKSENENVKETAAKALCALSYDAVNCITLHRNGVVSHLLQATSSKNPALQSAAAGCLANIRILALEADQVHYQGRTVEEIKNKYSIPTGT